MFVWSGFSLRRLCGITLVWLLASVLMVTSQHGPAFAETPKPGPGVGARPGGLSALGSDTDRPVEEGSAGGTPGRAELPVFVEPAEVSLPELPAGEQRTPTERGTAAKAGRVAERGQTWTDYENPDGSRARRMSTDVINYQSPVGVWAEVDNSLVDDGAGGLVNKANSGNAWWNDAANWLTGKSAGAKILNFACSMSWGVVSIGCGVVYASAHLIRGDLAAAGKSVAVGAVGALAGGLASRAVRYGSMPAWGAKRARAVWNPIAGLKRVRQAVGRTKAQPKRLISGTATRARVPRGVSFAVGISGGTVSGATSTVLDRTWR